MVSAKRTATTAVAARRVEKKKHRKNLRLETKKVKREAKQHKAASAAPVVPPKAAAAPYRPVLPASVDAARTLLAALSEGILADPAASLQPEGGGEGN
eukprot:CAMPEP_0194280950 /NCGR_PEP_ID=MMETSP0169-20130528/19299_1 /TAXON_ID=218684 /ORGANISM="Corethron pennatum, Strain L29A3" /LENGTH=97 /DNA_ID=CAMNT_0039025859 /DNA_START=61 /DNA_END=351 /DNA_ORIENTATION=+